MNTRNFTLCAASSILLALSSNSFASVSGDLLTGSKDTTEWFICDPTDTVNQVAEGFDPGLLDAATCAYRETPVAASQSYKLTCGVSSLKYASLTLAFLDNSGNTLSTKTTEIFEETNGGAFTVELEAPAGTLLAATGIYGLHGTGFQDCTLLEVDPDPGPVDGSIAGVTWFDENGDSLVANTESLVPSTPVSILNNGAVLASTTTGLDGAYYFGGLNLDQCYQVSFGFADPTLTYTTAGGDNSASAEGLSEEICLTSAMPNVTDVDAGYVAVPPVVPPEDYAICGATFITADGMPVADLTVKLMVAATGETYTTSTDEKGNYAFFSLPGGNYNVSFDAPGGYEFSPASSDLNAGSSFAGPQGNTPMISLPGDSNTNADDACKIRHVNAGFIKTPVALDPTIAKDDDVTGFVGDALSVAVLGNDMPCDAQAQSVDIIGHNVPGHVTYDAASQMLVITDTTAAGTFSVEYGLRGVCGSYDTAVVTVTLNEVPPPPPPLAPDAPALCKAAIGQSDRVYTGVHVDIAVTGGQSKADFAQGYNFYDADGNLIYSGVTAEANSQGARFGFDFSIYFRKREHGIEVLDVDTVRAVENGVESNPLVCTAETFTPIAVDVDNNGRVESIVGNFSIDMDGDGIDEQLAEWFSPTDGILIQSNYGEKISGTHLFGDLGGKYSDGFAKLALKDLNNDGQLSGAELSGLAIWIDSNSNATVEDHEISTLAAHSIAELSVEHYKFSARATLTDGGTLMMRDVWFAATPITQAAK